MNKTYCILVADGTRARLFALDPDARAPGVSGPDLVEYEDRVNPEHELAGHDKYSTTRTGENLNPRKGPTHGYDDHRAQEEREHERRFAQDIAQHAVKFAAAEHAAHLVVVAEKRMLGLLRAALVLPAHPKFELRELAKDLTHFSAADLHAHLADAGLLPARHTP